MMTERMTGVYAAVATPLDGAGTADAALLANHCRDLLGRGCHGIGLLGTTGEATSFSADERRRLLDAILAAGIPASALLLGAGAAAVSDAAAILRHGVAAGVRDFLILPPFYYKNLGEAGLAAWYGQVIEAAGTPVPRVVLYHIPQFSGVAITAGLIATLQERYPGVIVGVKDSSGDPASAAMFLRETPSIGLLVGTDTLMRGALGAGGAGCITGLANIVCEDLRLVFDHHADRTAARQVDAAQARLEALWTMSRALPPVAGMKALIAERRGEPAWRRMRPPLAALPEDALPALRGALATALAAGN